MVTPYCEGDWEIESRSVTKRKGKGFARQTAVSVTDQLEAETLGADQHSWKPDASPSRVSRRRSSKPMRTGLEPFGKCIPCPFGENQNTVLKALMNPAVKRQGIS